MNEIRMGKYLVILGTGGFAKEAAEWAEDAGYSVIGFFDKTKPELVQFLGRPSFSNPDSLRGLNASFLGAIGDNKVRQAESQALIELGLMPCDPVIHPKATVARSAVIGKGTIICPNTVICPDTVIGEGCIFNLNSTLGHDSSVGNYVNVAPGANLSGFSDIRDYVYIGTNSALREKLTVGAYATVGMGATVVKSVENHTTVIGSAAKPLEKK